MKETSNQLQFQRIRNRIIEILELFSSLDEVAKLGAFEAINMADDWLSVEYDFTTNVLSESEKAAVAEFLNLLEAASEAVEEDTQNVTLLMELTEWREISKFAQRAVLVFGERGRFSEEAEQNLPLSFQASLRHQIKNLRLSTSLFVVLKSRPCSRNFSNEP